MQQQSSNSLFYLCVPILLFKFLFVGCTTSDVFLSSMSSCHHLFFSCFFFNILFLLYYWTKFPNSVFELYSANDGMCGRLELKFISCKEMKSLPSFFSDLKPSLIDDCHHFMFLFYFIIFFQYPISCELGLLDLHHFLQINCEHGLFNLHHLSFDVVISTFLDHCQLLI